MATTKLVRRPKIIALNTSRPAPSVPNQATVPLNILSPGERRESKILTTFKSYGSVGAKIGAQIAQTIIKKSKVREIKVAGFKNVTSDIELQRVTIVVPAPTLEDLERIEDDLDRVARSTVSNLTKVKANSSQRLKAGLENEYIEVAEAGKARKNLDEIIAKILED